MIDVSPNPVEAHQVVRGHASAFSAQSKLANRSWLVVLTLVVYSTQTATLVDNESLKKLPFGFGTAAATDFDVAIYFIISIATISFCALFAQTLRVYDAAHTEIGKLENVAKQRQFFDILTNPTLFRVGPLSLTNIATANNFINRVMRIYYLFLRGFAGIIMLGVPAFGVAMTAHNLTQTSCVHFLLQGFGLTTLFFVALSLVVVGIKQYEQIRSTYKGVLENRE